MDMCSVSFGNLSFYGTLSLLGSIDYPQRIIAICCTEGWNRVIEQNLACKSIHNLATLSMWSMLVGTSGM